MPLEPSFKLKSGIIAPTAQPSGTVVGRIRGLPDVPLQVREHATMYLCCLLCLCGACAPSVAVMCKCRWRCQVASSRESPHTDIDALHVVARNPEIRAVDVKEH